LSPAPAPAGAGIPAQVGPYRIERELARGGMGIVYLARDTRLDRAVAIKALPDDVAADPDRLARFEREAKTLASLNHPNIAGIYGVEESGGRRYLALEHVEGETLAARIVRGPLPLAETQEICLQIAAGVEAAHENGVIHRDLKPGNVMITPGDHVKVLDFGLAKGKVAADDRDLLANSPTLTESPVLPQSPTIHSPATLPGVILGTAAYLSPEQARGKAVDRRTDIWSFGCVLYECLTGKRAFEGETVSDTIARILERDVEWTRLPKATPARIRELLKHCLKKDPRKRLRDIGEARLVLEQQGAGADAGAYAASAEPAALPKPPSRVQRLFEGRGGILFGIGLALGAALGVKLWGGAGDIASSMRRADHAVTRLSLPIPPDLKALDADLTPDGRVEVLRAQPRSEPRPRIYVRPFDKASFEAIRGTEGALGFSLSPGGRWVVFAAPISERTAQARLFKAPLDGSAPPVPVADWRENWRGGGLWLPSGDLVVAADQGKSFLRVPLTGEPPSKPRKFDAPDSSASFFFTGLLPGNRAAFLGVTYYERGGYHEGIGIVDLKTGKTRVLFSDGGSPHYASTGHILYTRRDVLYAAPFDLGRLALTGEPLPVMDGLRAPVDWSNGAFNLSENGTLQIAPGGAAWANRHAVIVRPGGTVSEWSGERQAFESSMAVSPSGNRFAGVISNTKPLYEIWVSDRGRRVSRRVIALPDADCDVPCWSPDGSRIAYAQFARTEADGIYVASVAGTETPRLIFRSGPRYDLAPLSWSPDGSHILVSMTVTGKQQLASIPGSASPGAASEQLPPGPAPLFEGSAEYGGGTFAPDGRSIAFVSDETGRREVYVCGWGSNAPAGDPLVVSEGGGEHPRWSRDGRRLYYRTPQNKIMSVSIATKPQLTASAPSLAWDLDAFRIAGDNLFDILPDGSLLGIQKAASEDEITRFDITLNFFEELKQRFAAAEK
jgi:serine/threonine-protein kinase